MKALRKFALAVTLLVVVVPATGAAKTPGEDPSERMVAAINEVRAKHGLAPLRVAPKLGELSARHARQVIRTDSFNHGTSYRRAGFRTAGEAMAYNRGWSRRTAPAIRLWLGSPGHRALVLSRSFRYAGAGMARGNFAGGASTVWVAQFGAR